MACNKNRSQIRAPHPAHDLTLTVLLFWTSWPFWAEVTWPVTWLCAPPPLDWGVMGSFMFNTELFESPVGWMTTGLGGRCPCRVVCPRVPARVCCCSEASLLRCCRECEAAVWGGGWGPGWTGPGGGCCCSVARMEGGSDSWVGCVRWGFPPSEVVSPLTRYTSFTSVLLSPLSRTDCSFCASVKAVPPANTKK